MTIRIGTGTPINHAKAAAWSINVFEEVLYGGPTDLWGRAWTVNEINGVNFGVGVRATMYDYPDPDDDLVGKRTPRPEKSLDVGRRVLCHNPER